jgi:RNA polymerase sigma-70 factor, ECF subfamily
MAVPDRPDGPPSAAQSEAFTRCWIRSQPAVAAFIRSLVPHLQDAEDLLQNVAVVTLRKFHEYDLARSFLPWALGIARNEVLSHRRSHATSSLIVHSGVVDHLAEAVEQVAAELDDRVAVLRRCQEGVSGRAKEILRLRYEEALPLEEIAARLRVSHVSVRVMISRIRTALLSCIERGLPAAGARRR